jgi:hypothetical protein
MELEVEVKVTLHVQNDHFVHGRAVVKLNEQDIDHLVGYNSGAGHEYLTGKDVKSTASRVLREAFTIASDEMWEEISNNVEAIDG